MKTSLRFPALALAFTAAATAPAQGQRMASATPSPSASTAAPIAREAFRSDMRRLWEDHVMWTRMYIVSAVSGLPDLDATAKRLLRNQADIGDAIKPFYGEAAGARLTTLLRDHILTAAALIGAAKSGDQTATTAASARWYANADSIAAFLAAANANWPAATLRSMMRQHLSETLAEATARLQGRHAEEIAAYDQVHEHILMMADALSNGIVSQFPANFF